ncbi:hypothetical protein KPL76_03935 [Subtercola sp. PAMC28395]|uniref:hypothetical protein n=1 Tax=Subtercola sp. PAMC28395 TaxID=2846775 RepID=UPI001C0C85B5|nr:hypothetical protein [Subtercola sp. PAMC28395]QWT24550.1 hypothetical protein KPL76_03935 [Subtercola sp. PAMC28395]
MSSVDAARTRDGVSVEYCGEWFSLEADTVFSIGRDADLGIDDNQFLHRRFLEIHYTDGLWWLSNVGTRLSATVSDGEGRVQAWLAPGARLPVVFSTLVVIFTAGPTTYEFTVHASQPTFSDSGLGEAASGVTTVGAVTFTPSQKLVILALAEPMLLREGTGMSELPTSVMAAKRLGWASTRFNRKLDNVCDKLDRAGVQGLRGGLTSYATNRRARLIEHAIATRIVTRIDLPLLDAPQNED